MADQQAILEVLAKLQPLIDEFDRAEKDIDRVLGKIDDEARKASEGMEHITKATRGVSDGLKFLRDAFALLKLGQFVESSIKAGAALEDLQIRLGESNFGFVKDEAQRLGVAIESLGPSFAKFTAATEGTNLAGEETRRIFTAVTEAVLSFGGTSQQVSGALKALEQIVSKGTLSTEELRRQLGDQLPGAFQTAADSIGVTTRQLEKLIEQGEISSEKFLPAFANALETKFNPALETTNRKIERFKNEVVFLKAAFAEGFSDELKTGLDQTRESMQNLEEDARKLGQGLAEIGVFIKNLSQIVVGGLGVGLGQVVDVVSSLAEGLARLAQKTVNLLPGFQGLKSGVDNTVDALTFFDDAVEGFIESSAEDAKRGLEGMKLQFGGVKTAVEETTVEVEKVAGALRRVVDPLDELTGKQRDLIASAQKLREETTNLVAAFGFLKEQAGDTSIEQAKLGSEAQKLLKEFQKLGLDAPEALKAIAIEFESTGEIAKKFKETVESIQKSISDTVEKLFKDLAKAREEASKPVEVGDAEKNVQTLRKEIDSLRQKTSLSVEESNRLSDATSELALAEADLADVTKDAGAEIDDFARKQESAAQIGKAAASVMADTEKAVQSLKQAFPGLGSEVADEVQQQIDAFELQRDAVGVTAQDVRAFGDIIDSILVSGQRRASQQAQELARRQRETGEAGKQAGEGLTKAADAAKGVGEIFDESGKLIKEFGDDTKEAGEGTEELNKQLEELGIQGVDGPKTSREEMLQLKSVIEETTVACEALKECLATLGNI